MQEIPLNSAHSSHSWEELHSQPARDKPKPQPLGLLSYQKRKNGTPGDASESWPAELRKRKRM